MTVRGLQRTATGQTGDMTDIFISPMKISLSLKLSPAQVLKKIRTRTSISMMNMAGQHLCHQNLYAVSSLAA